MSFTIKQKIQLALLLKKLGKSMEVNKMNFNKGWKTYAVALIYGLVTVGDILGFIPKALADEIRNFLLATGLATLRHGISNGK